MWGICGEPGPMLYRSAGARKTMSGSLQRGYAALQARNVPEDIQWLERAHGENPEDIQAMAWLGQTLCSVGRRAEGFVRLRGSGRRLLETARQRGDLKPVLV